MKKPRYLLWILLTEAVGILSGLLSRQEIGETIVKPPLSPPALLFPLVWTVLYGLMGIGAARVDAAQNGPDKSRALNVFVIQLVVNFFWSLIFFNTRSFGFALLWLLLLWVLILAMVFLFWKVDRTAALLQIPYVLWVTFAAYLNYGIWQLNR